MDIRPARCPACGHRGGVPRTAPMDRQVRCVACGTRALVRQVVGERPARSSRKSTHSALVKAAAQEVLARAGGLNDAVDDLFVGGA
jgi:DNA-directed RNA polymerase subunit RPC12/RpoP